MWGVLDVPHRTETSHQEYSEIRTQITERDRYVVPVNDELFIADEEVSRVLGKSRPDTRTGHPILTSTRPHRRGQEGRDETTWGSGRDSTTSETVEERPTGTPRLEGVGGDIGGGKTPIEQGRRIGTSRTASARVVPLEELASGAVLTDDLLGYPPALEGKTRSCSPLSPVVVTLSLPSENTEL